MVLFGSEGVSLLEVGGQVLESRLQTAVLGPGVPRCHLGLRRVDHLLEAVARGGGWCGTLV
jgi:hypothetical protein